MQKQSWNKQQLYKANEIALHIWKYARDQILIHLRFLNAAVSNFSFKETLETDVISSDGSAIYYNPFQIISQYKRDPALITRCYLHIIFHYIFNHAYRYEKLDQDMWDLASDIAIENVILELGLDSLNIVRDKQRKEEIEKWKNKIGMLTAEKIYHSLKENPLELDEMLSLSILFKQDDHKEWKKTEILEISMQEWQRISQRVKAELKSFSGNQNNKSDSIVQNLEEATREHYDYGDFLRRFCSSGEEMTINDEEFDYVYYTYGLELYGNLPLVEPLEYKDVNKIKEFVVAIDTSGSCRGKLVQTFLQKTYDILKDSENFFRKVNIHIIQCDSEIQSDTKITCDEEFEAFMKNGKLTGFGSTDFRPVFRYVDECIAKKEFENLKGLIYFTDGYGIYPEQMPPYDTAFVFLEDDFQQPQIPPWAIKLVLSKDELE